MCVCDTLPPHDLCGYIRTTVCVCGQGGGRPDWEDMGDRHRRQRKREAEGFPHRDVGPEAAQAEEERLKELSHQRCRRCWESAAFPATESEMTTGGTTGDTGKPGRKEGVARENRKGTAADLSSRDPGGSSLSWRLSPDLIGTPG